MIQKHRPLIVSTTQLKTALNTKVVITGTKEKLSPSFAILCASGKINQTARGYIVNEIKDPRIRFFDADDLIPEIDESYPELWYGIDADKFPYLRNLIAQLSSSEETFVLSDLLPPSAVSPITDEAFVQLRLMRIALELKRIKGRMIRQPKFDQIEFSGLLERKETQILILGEAGSGKSTALKRIAFFTANRALRTARDIKIPVFIKARDIAYEYEGRAIVEILGIETAKLTMSEKPCFSAKDLTEGNLLVLVDALDELPSDLKKVDVLNRLEIFHSMYPSCKIIVTSREYTFVEELGELAPYETFRITPIDWKQAERIVKRIRRKDALPEEAIKEMIRRIQEVHGVELNPLLITVFVATSDYSRRDIPANITELFKKYTEMMLGRWDASKGLGQQYHAPLKDFLLCQLAFEMHKRKITSISVREARRILETELSERGKEGTDINTLVEEMIDRSGLFRVVDSGLEFRHLLLQEFFAGRGIPSVDFLQSIVADEWWRRAFVFQSGENPGDHISLQTIIDAFVPQTDREAFHAAITLGLALQACYLVKVDPKSAIFWWVLTNIVKAKMHFLPKEGKDRFPVTRFLSYYLFGREAVACDIVKMKAHEFLKKHKISDASDVEKEIFQFWTIVGMIECGYLEKAEKLIKAFHPRERRLLLALYLGCILIANLRVSTKEQKKIAKRICDNISPHIRDLKTKLLDEFRSELIEVQKGKIQPLDPPKTDSGGGQ